MQLVDNFSNSGVETVDNGQQPFHVAGIGDGDGLDIADFGMNRHCPIQEKVRVARSADLGTLNLFRTATDQFVQNDSRVSARIREHLRASDDDREVTRARPRTPALAISSCSEYRRRLRGPTLVEGVSRFDMEVRDRRDLSAYQR